MNRALYRPLPVSPSGVSGISACHFRTCWSLDQLWIFRVGPATFKYRRALKSKNTKTPSILQACPFSRILSWDSASQPSCFFFHHLVPHVCPSIWHIETSRASLWSPRYSEKRNLPEYFASTFSLVIPISNESEHTKFDYWLSTYCWQFSTCNHFLVKWSTDPRVISILPTASISLCFPSRFSVC